MARSIGDCGWKSMICGRGLWLPGWGRPFVKTQECLQLTFVYVCIYKTLFSKVASIVNISIAKHFTWKNQVNSPIARCKMSKQLYSLIGYYKFMTSTFDLQDSIFPHSCPKKNSPCHQSHEKYFRVHKGVSFVC